MHAFARQRELPESPSGEFFAVLRPCGALPGDRFETAVFAMLALSAFSCVVAEQLGVWPVGIAVGLAGLLTASLFVVWRTGLDRSEEVRLCGGELCVRRYRKGRLVDQRRFGLDRARLLRRDDPDHGCLGLCLERRGSRFCIAADMVPAERDRFARNLVSAVQATGRSLPVVSIPPKRAT